MRPPKFFGDISLLLVGNCPSVLLVRFPPCSANNSSLTRLTIRVPNMSACTGDLLFFSLLFGLFFMLKTAEIYPVLAPPMTSWWRRPLKFVFAIGEDFSRGFNSSHFYIYPPKASYVSRVPSFSTNPRTTSRKSPFSPFVFGHLFFSLSAFFFVIWKSPYKEETKMVCSPPPAPVSRNVIAGPRLPFGCLAPFVFTPS